VTDLGHVRSFRPRKARPKNPVSPNAGRPDCVYHPLTVGREFNAGFAERPQAWSLSCEPRSPRGRRSLGRRGRTIPISQPFAENTEVSAASRYESGQSGLNQMKKLISGASSSIPRSTESGSSASSTDHTRNCSISSGSIAVFAKTRHTRACSRNRFGSRMSISPRI
jgi:hypothetical protein